MDFFGNIFGEVAKAFIGKGLKSAFGGKEKSKPQLVMPRFGGLCVESSSASEAGEVEEIEITDYDVVKAMWDKRLFGDKSYTNITITPTN